MSDVKIPEATIRVCPERDSRCPHGIECPFSADRYGCDMDGSRKALAIRTALSQPNDEGEGK